MMTGVTDQLGSSSLPIGLFSASKEKLEKVSAGTAESRKKSSVSQENSTNNSRANSSKGNSPKAGGGYLEIAKDQTK